MHIDQKIIDDYRGQIKLTRNKIAMLTATLGVDSDDMTLRNFVYLLENLQYRPDALRAFLKENGM